jgi:hypothetical protein
MNDVCHILTLPVNLNSANEILVSLKLTAAAAPTTGVRQRMGVTINTTSTYVNMASVHSVRYDLLFAILCHRQSIFKRSINIVDLEWLCLHLFCPAN